MSAPERTKAARNEIRKINATFNNNIAVGMTIAGYWTPAVTFMITSYQTMQKVIGNDVTGFDKRETYTLISVVGIAFFSLLSARTFRTRAAQCLHDYED